MRRSLPRRRCGQHPLTKPHLSARSDGDAQRQIQGEVGKCRVQPDRTRGADRRQTTGRGWCRRAMTLRAGPGPYPARRDAGGKVGLFFPPGGTRTGWAFSCRSARCGVVVMMDVRLIRRGQMYRYYLRQVVVGDHLCLARTSLGEAQAKAGVPPGRWMGRGLGDLGLRAGAIVTENELRQLFTEGRHPHGDRLVAEQLAAGKTPAVAARAGKLGRAVEVTGADLVFRPQPTIELVWALGEEETRRVIEAAHEWAIEATLAWIEDHAATIRVGAQGRYPTRPVHGLAFARFRHYESRAGTSLLHDHVLVSLRGLRPDGKWGAVHSTTLLENVVAASSLYNELVMAEVCEELDVASEPRTVSAGRRPVMEIAGVPHELIGWMSKRGREIDLCRSELEHEYVTAVDEDGNLKFASVVSEEARTKLNRIAARKTRPPKPEARSLAQLRTDWRVSAKEFLGEAAELVDMLLERAWAAAVAIRARVAETLDVALAALGVSAMVFVMSSNGLLYRRHLLAETRRFLALVQRGRQREPGLDDEIVNAAIATYCLDVTEPKTTRGLLADYRLYTTHWAHPDPARSRRRAPEAVPDVDHRPPAGLTAPNVPAPPGKPGSGISPATLRSCRWSWGNGTSPAFRSATTARSSPPPPSPTNCAPRAARDEPAITRASSRTSRPRCPNSSSSSLTPTLRSRRTGASRRTTWRGCGRCGRSAPGRAYRT
ncbi:MobF family relaxase [Streptomyces cinereoruber]|uniref:MobF family relaxase n=1 Tax=Streptomyces cinereoruber TaxID=67260 RepID=UPI003C2C64A5